MSLRLPRTASDFFRHIPEYPPQLSGKRFMEMDKYYACLMFGLKAGELGSEGAVGPDTFVAAGAGYPDAYKASADLIAGLLVETEMRRNDVDLNDRDQIENETVKLLKPNSALGLSDKGVDLLNRYAVRGLDYLKSKLGEPRRLEVFLLNYRRVWDTLDTQ